MLKHAFLFLLALYAFGCSATGSEGNMAETSKEEAALKPEEPPEVHTGEMAAYWSDLHSAVLPGATLHYVARGDGPPVIFVHGSLADYREWRPVAERLSGYRTTLYSRRYNWPNDNALASDHSARIEAQDLAALIEYLDIAPAHVVGVSYGGYTALALALKRPDLVRTLTVAEPALVGWLPQIDGGAELYNDFYARMWLPSSDAARAGDAEAAIRITMDYFAGDGAWDEFPPEVRSEILSNGREWVALTTSADAYPDKTPEAAEALSMPLLIITGGNTMPMLKLIDAEIAARRPDARHVIIPDATHQMCSEQPAACASAIQSFFDEAEN